MNGNFASVIYFYFDVVGRKSYSVVNYRPPDRMFVCSFQFFCNLVKYHVKRYY